MQYFQVILPVDLGEQRLGNHHRMQHQGVADMDDLGVLGRDQADGRQGALQHFTIGIVVRRNRRHFRLAG